MRIRAGVIAALALSCAPTSAIAQDQAFLRSVGVDARNAMLANIDSMMCGAVACTPASDAERANPPVTDDEAASIAAVAVVSAVAEHCGLDWTQGSFLPMMARWRSAPDITDRKLALIGATHGFVQGQAVQAFAAQGECDEQTRTAMQSQFDQTRD